MMKLTATLLVLATSPMEATAKGIRGLRKLQVQLVGFGGQPPANRFPLQQCQGDCDGDRDCAPGLICYQRGPREEVPGCNGGSDYPAATDFCIELEQIMEEETWYPTWSPTFSPTVGVTESMEETMGPTEMVTESQYDMSLPELEYVGDNMSNMPMGLCQGDCDSDDDCIDELVCFQRDYNLQVPGCRPGQDLTSVDYCVLPATPEPEVATTLAPTSAATWGGTEAGTDFVVALMVVGDNVGMPLGLCQGDCDTNDDCLDDLICFQRNSFEPVPGCIGQGSASYDYCIADPDAMPSPTMMLWNDTATIAASTSAPTMFSVVVAAEGAPPTSSPTIQLPLLATVNEDTEARFGLCQGACESNDDCQEGLICLERNRGDAVPGCAGVPNKGDDYCVYPF